jgi:hypothetical protein
MSKKFDIKRILNDMQNRKLTGAELDQLAGAMSLQQAIEESALSRSEDDANRQTLAKAFAPPSPKKDSGGWGN